MRCYFGYPDSFLEREPFRVKDLFLEEINVDYGSVPVEVKRKLLSVLDNVHESNYLFIGNVIYDAIDILEFSLFSLPVREISSIVLSGYLYGKSTFLVRNLFRNTFASNPEIFFDFNFFPDDSLVVNVGYTQTSISVGGKYLLNVPIGEFHFVDVLGNYLFNRFIYESGVSNASLRKSGKRGEILDRMRSAAARILFKGQKSVEVKEFEYEREVEEWEVDAVLSTVVGSCGYGDFFEAPFDFSTSVVHALYRFEEIFKERPRIKNVAVIGRLRRPIVKTLKKIIPVKPAELTGVEFADMEVVNKSFKPVCERVDFPKLRWQGEEVVNQDKEEPSLHRLRYLFNQRDLKGISVLEDLVENGDADERVVYELLSILKRCSFKRKEDIVYLNYAISALSKLEIPEGILPKVIEEIGKKAFRWEIPLNTKMNVLYFCYKYKEKLNNTLLEIFPAVLSTYVRNVKLPEGERNFIKVVAESVLSKR
ncbi:hypothetical protein SAMN06265339_0032 [Desulfurobacterium pacificum]|uniref:Uncharacterized protein n=1 Tax=Desulfurobacterium pacificum TaxID=240166 RepID=A0ABY1N766_9BACT|nr:hypothetical protein [Desulfurobacterium pacificum]SMP02215.1 hypothetical protein SAMN06265339_0032 [Desulfurobacterium pacificum]